MVLYHKGGILDFFKKVSKSNEYIIRETGWEIKLLSSHGVEINIPTIFRNVLQIIDSNYSAAITKRQITANISIKNINMNGRMVI